jgi:hypothetical protein
MCVRKASSVSAARTPGSVNSSAVGAARAGVALIPAPRDSTGAGRIGLGVGGERSPARAVPADGLAAGPAVASTVRGNHGAPQSRCHSKWARRLRSTSRRALCVGSSIVPPRAWLSLTP